MQVSSNDDVEHEYASRDAHWRSLVEVLRTRMLQLQSEGKLHNASLGEPLQNEFIASADRAFLSVWLCPEDGCGSWNQIAPLDECEPWSLGADGIAILSEQRLSIPDLAEAFALKLIAART